MMTKIKRGMLAEDLYRLTFVNNPELSPEGDRVAFVQATIDTEREYRSHLYVQSVHGGMPIQWTYGNVRDSSPRWSPDGTQLAFVSNRSGQPQIWLISTQGKEARQLTNCKHGAKNPVWSPDGGFILFSTPLAAGESVQEEACPDGQKAVQNKQPMVVERLKYKSDQLGFLDGKYCQLAVIEVRTGELRQLTDGNFDHGIGAWSFDGTRIAFSANRTDDPDRSFTSDVCVISLGDGTVQQLTNSTGAFTQPVWSPDGTQLACLGHQLEYDGATLSRIWTIDVQSGDLRCVTADWDVQAGDVAIGDMRSGHAEQGALWAADGKGLYFLASDRGNTSLYYTTLDGDVSLVVGGERQVFALTMDRLRHTAVLGISDPSNPGDLYHVTLAEGTERRLTSANQQVLDEVTLSLPEPIAFTAPDGWTVHGWIMKPIGFQDGQKYPLILEIHGGPHAMYANTFFHEMQVLAAKGYAVLFTNPRGSHGYGQQFVDACRGDYGGKDYLDLMSAVDFVLNQFDFIDETRLGVTGGSYGGFMTNWIVGQTNRFKAAATQRSISNWLSFYGVSDIGYFFAEWEIHGNLYANPEKLWSHSPLRHVANIETPLLILHGERDYRCPIEQAEQLFVALKHQNKAPVKFVRFPGANHELSRSGDPELRVARLNYIADWFATYL